METDKDAPVTAMPDSGEAAPASRPLVLACDEAYAMPLATALRSVAESHRGRRPLEFHVITDGFSESAQRKVLGSLPPGAAKIRWIDADLGIFREFSTLTHISRATFARLLVSRIFPESVSRVLYLDADILVLDDLAPIWETDLAGAVVGAVLDKGDQLLKRGEEDFEGVPRVLNYFNAGVLLIDLDQWRKLHISERALQYLSQHPRTPYADQDALNVVCDGRWKRLDPRWNFQDHFETSIAAMEPGRRPGIVHFVMREKPWVASILSVNAGFYDAFRSRTLFARSGRDKLRDLRLGLTARMKGFLRRYPVLRSFWNRIRPSLQAQMYRPGSR